MARFKVNWTPNARRHLNLAIDYIYARNPSAAKDMFGRIIAAASILEDHSLIGRPGRVEQTRELPVSNSDYIIVYKIYGDEIRIAALQHTSRAWPDTF